MALLTPLNITLASSGVASSSVFGSSNQLQKQSGVVSPRFASTVSLVQQPIYFGASARKWSVREREQRQAQLLDLTKDVKPFQKILKQATQIAQAYGHDTVTPLHILLAHYRQVLPAFNPLEGRVVVKEPEDGPAKDKKMMADTVVPEELLWMTTYEDFETGNARKMIVNTHPEVQFCLKTAMQEMEAALAQLPKSASVSGAKPPVLSESTIRLYAESLRLMRKPIDDVAKLLDETRDKMMVNEGSPTKQAVDAFQASASYLKTFESVKKDLEAQESALNEAVRRQELANKTRFQQEVLPQVTQEFTAQIKTLESEGVTLRSQIPKATPAEATVYQGKAQALQTAMGQRAQELMAQDTATLNGLKAELGFAQKAIQDHVGQYEQMEAVLAQSKAALVDFEKEFDAGKKQQLREIRLYRLLAALHNEPQDPKAVDPVLTQAQKLHEKFIAKLRTQSGGAAFEENFGKLMALASTNGATEGDLDRIREMGAQAKLMFAKKQHILHQLLCKLARVEAETPWTKIRGKRVDLSRARQLLLDNPITPPEVREQVMRFLKRGNANGWKNEPMLVLSGAYGTELVKQEVIAVLQQILDVPVFTSNPSNFAPITTRDSDGDVVIIPVSVPAQAMIQTKTPHSMVVLDGLEMFLGSRLGEMQFMQLSTAEGREKFKDMGLNVSVNTAPFVFVATMEETTRHILADVFKEKLGNDRDMSVVTLTYSYTPTQAKRVMRERIVPRVEREFNVKFADATIDRLVDEYFWSGRLDELKTLSERLAKRLTDAVITTHSVPLDLLPGQLDFVLGSPNAYHDTALFKEPTVGACHGLAVGVEDSGHTFPGSVKKMEIVEMARAPINPKELKPKYVLQSTTGPAVDMMKDATLRVQAYLHVANKRYKRLDTMPYNVLLQANFPSPADGNSAGAATATAAISQLTGIPVRPDVAMTGTCLAGGDIGSIGGTFDKIQGAKAARMKKVLVPVGNYKDLLAERPEILSDPSIEVVPIKHMDEVLRHALVDYDALNTPYPKTKDSAGKKKARRRQASKK
ncbi:MAG: hypothetical protein K2X01_09595 [Cyanobacteria bacterium]|nr:hypothetical protein [Cyanobacteriota bacterium]